MNLQIFPDLTYQTHEGFGGSGGWWAQEVGGWDSASPNEATPAEKIAELLFSKENGIGLTTYRYNIGGGSADSGKGNIDDRLRRAHAVYDECGRVNLQNDKNALHMLRLCVKAGASEVILFVNSPIEALTRNGWAHTNPKAPLLSNLPKKNIPAFANGVLNATEELVKENLPVSFVSPVNEPLWVWTGSQEGCHYTPKQCTRVYLEFARQMKNRPLLQNVKLSGAENGDIRWFNKSYTREFFKKPQIRAVSDGIDLHSYCLHFPLPAFFNNRVGFIGRYRRYLNRHYPDQKVRVSEWCHMQGGRDAGMASALETAKVIYEDLTGLNAVAWQHWLLCSPYDYCDGLIYINTKNKTFECTKRYDVTGNFSKFIPKGAQRIKITTDCKDILPLAYKTQGSIIQVFINIGATSHLFTAPTDSMLYLTDKNNSLTPESLLKGQSFIIPEKSVVTVISET